MLHDRERVIGDDTFATRVFGLAAIGLVGWGALLLLKPFIVPILWAALLALLVEPLSIALRLRLGGRRGLAASLLTMGAVLLIVVPSVVLVGVFVAQAGDLMRRLQESANAYRITRPADILTIPVVHGAVEWLSARVPVTTEQLQSAALQGGQRVLGRLLTMGASLFTSVLDQAIGILIALVLFFFFVRDGEEIAARALRLVPLDDRRKGQLADQLIAVARGVMLGSLATAVAQGTLVGLGFAIAGLPSPVVFGVIATIASLIPLVGAALVWAPAALLMGIQGHWGATAFLLAWSILLVSTVDNVIRPAFVSSRTNISTLPMFIGLFGGVSAFGAVGMFVGPAIVVLALALVRFAEESRETAGLLT